MQFNELNIMYTSIETINYLDEMDIPMELIDDSTDIKNNELSTNNIFSRLLSIFNNDKNINLILPEELKNTFYIKDKSPHYIEELILDNNMGDKYMYKYAVHSNKMTSYIDNLSEILKDLKLINDNISNKL